MGKRTKENMQHELWWKHNTIKIYYPFFHYEAGAINEIRLLAVALNKHIEKICTHTNNHGTLQQA